MNPDYQRYSDGRSAMGQVHVLPQRAAAVIGNALLAGFGGAFGILLTRLERHRGRRLLQGMSDHMLKDIGVTRADVDRETRKKFWRA